MLINWFADTCHSLQAAMCRSFPSADCIPYQAAFAGLILEPVDSQANLMLPILGTLPAQEEINAALVGVVKSETL